jgi:predicted dinucleotide-binding enzyme
VAGDDDAARDAVLDLVDSIPGLRAFDAGSLANAAGIEAFTAALITVNIRHRGQASVHLAGVEPRPKSSAA